MYLRTFHLTTLMRSYTKFSQNACLTYRQLSSTRSSCFSFCQKSSYFKNNVLTTCLRQKHGTKKELAYEVNTNVSRDVLVYSHMNNRFYTVFSYFGVVMFAFWCNLSWFAFDKMRDLPKEEEDKQLGIQRSLGVSWLKKWSLKEGIYKNGISFLCFCVGYMALFITVVYPLRSIHKLWLLKGGQSVKITTYSLFGRTRSFAVPLDEVTSLQGRTSKAVQIPMKIKGRWFFFLLDKKGKFHNPELYDFSVGLSRNLK